MCHLTLRSNTQVTHKIGVQLPQNTDTNHTLLHTKQSTKWPHTGSVISQQKVTSLCRYAKPKGTDRETPTPYGGGGISWNSQRKRVYMIKVTDGFLTSTAPLQTSPSEAEQPATDRHAHPSHQENNNWAKWKRLNRLHSGVGWLQYTDTCPTQGYHQK